ncbi:cytochrome b [Sphingomonas morindae]|uniref:Cytochrome b/b6 domain-containing protein n=1 Tax=Sphingomonas morindae TaxID=1541170 RepID=A0ABY4X7L9_9SPHN|nr:cytochrome b/b6 domain-containing protein [Sphingomonas morindae]USI72916.1 cytochrome b/b6 domain-containing protein [Sphingomonas morindae]
MSGRADMGPWVEPPLRRYGAVAMAFHWVIAVLVLANLTIGLLHESLLRGTIPLHKALGFVILVLTVARVAWRLVHRPPPLPAGARERVLARGVHGLLYALMLLLPLTGWIFTSTGPRGGPFWIGGLAVPALPLGPLAWLGGPTHEAHEIMGWAMLALVALHLAGAARHGLVLRDGVLHRMLPGRFAAPGRRTRG